MSMAIALGASRTAGRLRSALQAIGWSGLALVGVIAALSEFLAQAPADAQGVGPLLRSPSLSFPFGTDDLGRDILGEVLHGLTTTVERSLIAALVTIVAGGIFGFIAARSPRLLGGSLRWTVGILASSPPLLLAIFLVGVGARDFSAIAAGLAASPLAFIRVFDRARRDDHTAHAAYARATGISPATLLRRDLVYEIRDNLLNIAARALAAVTIILSTASFLGFGAVPPHRDLGLIIAAARPTYLAAWWTAAFPALALLLLVLLARLAAGLEEGERP
jgi:peptide/nickel transport system permease protein